MARSGAAIAMSGVVMAIFWVGVAAQDNITLRQNNINSSRFGVIDTSSTTTPARIDCDSGGDSVVDGLNLTNSCDRTTIDVLLMTIMYILIFLTGTISNASVILASIFERWKEIDQFTFVMAVSQAFCHFLLALFVYPMGLYAILRESGWALGAAWCTQTALLSSYFEIMYVLHIMMLGADIVIGKFTKLKDNVFVALSKRVAMSLWVVAVLPQIYVYISKGRTGFGYEGTKCYATYVYRTWWKFLEYFCIFIFIPLAFSVIQYVLLLKQSQKRHIENTRDVIKRKQQRKPNDGRTFWMNYRTSFIMILFYAISQFPRWIYIFLTIAISEKQLSLKTNYRIADFIVVWSSMGSIMIPIGYLITCPTYFSQVTQFTWMAWLKRWEPYLGLSAKSNKAEDNGAGEHIAMEML